MTTTPAKSLLDVLSHHSTVRPEAPAYVFLDDNVVETESVSFGGLERDARRIGWHLAGLAKPQDRALLLYPPGLDFIRAFLGCLYAGVIAVPVHARRSNHYWDRLQSIVADSKPALILSTRSFQSHLDLGFREQNQDQPFLVLTDELSASDEPTWHPPISDDDAVAFLQYTSGSTHTPKGVIVSHKNIAANEEMIRNGFRNTSDSVIVSWLPHYHDMGLIGGILQPLWVGAQCVLMSPNTFLRSPVSWLKAISAYRGTTSGGPNFGYELCTERISESQKQQLDLSSWQVAFNGAEPIRPKTVERFVESFKGCGFSRTAITPCYGLAEATLYVSAKVYGTEYSEYDPLPENHTCGVKSRSEDTKKPTLAVGCGKVGEQLKCVIVDPETFAVLPLGRIGEVLVCGPSVAQGYWNSPIATSETFGVRLEGHSSPFLRTGDLAFCTETDLVITGRLKDLIILNGRNIHAEDIEASAAGVDSRLRLAPAAAFAVEQDSRPLAVLVQELPRRTEPFDSLEGLAQSIRAAVAEEQEIVLDSVVLVRAGSIPRTTSGKVRRQACRELYLDGALGAQLELHSEDRSERRVIDDSVGPSDESDLLQNMRRVAAKLLRKLPDEIDTDASLLSLGFDSLMTVRLQAALEEELGASIPLDDMLSVQSLRNLTARAVLTDCSPENPVPVALETPGDYPLSPGQRALFYIQLLQPESASYNLFSASESRTHLNLSALEQSFQLLTDRHSLLRSTFVNGAEGPIRSVRATHPVSFRVTQGSDWDDETLHEYLHRAANMPFDLAHEPPLRVEVIQGRPGGDVLLIATHHIVADLWSAAILFSELATVYSALSDGLDWSLSPAVPVPYSAFVERQLHGSTSHGSFESQKAYWRAYLKDAHPVLSLPTTRTPESAAREGGSHWFQLEAELAERLKKHAKAAGVSLYTLLLASFNALLLRISAQDDILVGSPVAGPRKYIEANTVGYFVNQIVVRSRWNPESSFSEFLASMNRDIHQALENQDYPFSLLVDELGIKRQVHQTPLTQVLFGFQNTEHMVGNELAAFALGFEGALFQKGRLVLAAIPVESSGAQCDLTLFMADDAQQLMGLFQYDAGLFDRNSIERIANQYIVLLRAVTANTDITLQQLPILNELDKDRILRIWNSTQSTYAPDVRVGQLVETQARLTPDSIAIVAHDGELTYRSLSARATVIASQLRDQGVSGDTIVALHCSRSTHLPVAMLAILKAGGAFLPIDLALPQERVRYMLNATAASVALVDSDETQAVMHEAGVSNIIRVDLLAHAGEPRTRDAHWLDAAPLSDTLAYVIFTSGSTGTPKGVMVTHRNLANFFHAMNNEIKCDAGDRFYALTSISFDISILELLWPLTRGAELRLIPEQRRRGSSLLSIGSEGVRGPEFSLFYFADAPARDKDNPYELLLKGAVFADNNGFAAVWTPERHFHPFGGLYPNPSVTSAALAVITKRVRIRAGSVVLPLHNPIRVAEEWSTVDNLSKGRVDVAFASGWHADDFTLAPANYQERRNIMTEGISTVRTLWSGEKWEVLNGNGKAIGVELFPKPVQPELPIWITASGTAATFDLAGSLGANVLTHLLGQTVEDVAKNITRYREARAQAGFDPRLGCVSLMLHSFIGETISEVEQIVREPFKQYLRSSVGLIERFIEAMALPADLSKLTSEDMDALLEFAAQRYFGTSALFGTVQSCEPFVKQLVDIGVNEIACLIDFGVETEAALQNLARLRELMNRFRPHPLHSDRAIGTPVNQRTLLQCTPSLMKLLLAEDDASSPLHTVTTLLLGGEPLPPSLVAKIQEKFTCTILNMYGPTETTIWSTMQTIEDTSVPITVGRPIANTQCYILDRRGLPVDIGSVGELYIGGDGVARGYIGQPELTTERFVPDCFSGVDETRLYRTGDLARFRSDGAIEILGRADFQVKVRGHRIELPEIESALSAHPHVQSVIVVKTATDEDGSLIAYLVAVPDRILSADELRAFLGRTLPSYMIPSYFIQLDQLPLLSSGKADRKTLESRVPEQIKRIATASTDLSERSLEPVIQKIWREVLNINDVGLDDNFFDLGGHSLRMVQVHTALTERLGRPFPLIRLLENPTIRLLAISLASEEGRPMTHEETSSFSRAQLQRRSLADRRRTASSMRPVAS